MIGRFEDLPEGVQHWLLTFFDTADEVDRWLHARHPDLGCTPLQMLEAPPGLSRWADIVHPRRDEGPAARSA